MIDATRGREVAAMRRLLGMRSRAALERCDLCGAELPQGREHAHLVDARTQRVACACPTCAECFAAPAHGRPSIPATSGEGGARWAKVSARAQRLVDLALDDSEWIALGVPVRLAFFVVRSSRDVVAMLPSAAGLLQTEVPPGAWERLRARHPVVSELAVDLEALLVCGLGLDVAFHVSIDHAYRLAALARAPGGDLAAALRGFFARLEAPACPS